jgi:hypothetical protein
MCYNGTTKLKRGVTYALDHHWDTNSVMAAWIPGLTYRISYSYSVGYCTDSFDRQADQTCLTLKTNL